MFWSLLVPAAFRRLCVETTLVGDFISPHTPAAFRRLCVETLVLMRFAFDSFPQPPSGGCVLKPHDGNYDYHFMLPAAFRRLCVETAASHTKESVKLPSRLQAAVC